MTDQPDLVTLLLLAIPVATIAWTVTHEEIFREAREWCARRSENATNVFSRKFFYVFTCEYCFSHWVTIVALFVTHFRLLYDDWRGYGVAGFSIVWIANIYMSFFGRIRLDIRNERIEIETKEAALGDSTGAPSREPKK